MCLFQYQSIKSIHKTLVYRGNGGRNLTKVIRVGLNPSKKKKKDHWSSHFGVFSVLNSALNIISKMLSHMFFTCFYNFDSYGRHIGGFKHIHFFYCLSVSFTVIAIGVSTSDRPSKDF